MTEKPTSTIQIKQELDRKLAQIRSDQDLSAEAKRRYIAEAYEDASRRYQEAIETAEREAAEKVSRAERAVMQIRYPKLATEAEKASVRAAYRQARDTVSFAADFTEGFDEEARERELTQLLERAERSGDPELADAVYHVALERGLQSVSDAYLETRPEQKKRSEDYAAARQEAATVKQELGWAKSFGLQQPPELNTPVPVE